MSYNTNYDIINKETGDILFQNTNNSCFAQYVGFNDQAHKDYGFASGRIFKFYYNYHSVKTTEDIVKWWVKELNKIGLKCTYEIDDNFERKIINKSGYGDVKSVTGKTYIWTLDFDDYGSCAHTRLAMYLLRYLYEHYGNEPMCKTIESTREYINNQYINYQIDIPTWEAFQYVHMINQPGGHAFWYKGNIIAPVSLDVLNQKIESWKGKNTRSELDELYTLAYIQKEVENKWSSRALLNNIPITKLSIVPNIETNYEIYTKEIERLKNE